MSAPVLTPKLDAVEQALRLSVSADGMLPMRLVGEGGNEISMKTTLLVAATLLVIGSFLGGTNAVAMPQGGSGVVTGIVLGPDKKPVPNAIITYQNAGGSAPHMAHADARGHFTISKLKGDVYSIRATNNGVSSDWETVAVHPGKTRTIALRAIHEKEEVKQYTATHTYEQQTQ